MLNKVFRFGCMATVLCAAIVTSCKKGGDDNPAGSFDGKLNGTLASTVKDADSVFLYFGHEYYNLKPVETAVVKDGKFSVTLPTPTGNDLSSFAEEEGGTPDGLVVTPKDVKTASVTLCIKVKTEGKDDEAPNLLHALDLTIGDNAGFVVFIYSDKDASITGKMEEGSEISVSYDLQLKKGWNSCIMQGTEKEGKVTSAKIPANAEWK